MRNQYECVSELGNVRNANAYLGKEVAMQYVKVTKEQLISRLPYLREKILKAGSFEACARAQDGFMEIKGLEYRLARELARLVLGDKVKGSCSPSGFSHTEIEGFEPFIIRFLDKAFKVSISRGYQTSDPLVYKSDSLRIEFIN